MTRLSYIRGDLPSKGTCFVTACAYPTTQADTPTFSPFPTSGIQDQCATLVRVSGRLDFNHLLIDLAVPHAHDGSDPNTPEGAHVLGLSVGVSLRIMASMSDSIVTPDDWVRHLCEGQGLRIEDLGVAPTVLGCWGYSLVEKLAHRANATLSSNWLYGTRHPLYTGSIGGRPVSFSHYPNGAPGTVKIMEELAVAGADTFITLGWTGSLQPGLEVGDLVLPTAVVSSEGTSGHYIGDTTQISPHPELVTALEESARALGVSIRRGTVWSTDACYRETREQVSQHRAAGVLGVEFETAGVLAFGQYRGLRTANLLVVSDELGDTWRPGFQDSRHFDSTIKGLDILYETVAKLSES